jgi:hypothetical protein
MKFPIAELENIDRNRFEALLALIRTNETVEQALKFLEIIPKTNSKGLQIFDIKFQIKGTISLKGGKRYPSYTILEKEDAIEGIVYLLDIITPKKK